jgi:hypothetical protein
MASDSAGPRPAETHQQATAGRLSRPPSRGASIADDQNTLRAGQRGPALLEDFHFREKSSILTMSASQNGWCTHAASARMATSRITNLSPRSPRPACSRWPGSGLRPSCGSPQSLATNAPVTWPATSTASRSSCIPTRATGTSSATISRSSSSGILLPRYGDRGQDGEQGTCPVGAVWLVTRHACARSALPRPAAAAFRSDAASCE